MHRRTLLSAIALGSAGIAPRASAQGAWPERPISFMVAYSPGSANDILVRLVQRDLSAQLGQPVIVENRAGAGGTVGTALVARAAADGYTLGLGSTATLAVNRALFRRLSYDPKSDFTVVTMMATTPNVVVVPAASPLLDMARLVSRAREAGGRSLRFSSPGNGTTQHLSGVLLNQSAAMESEHVPYRGPAEAVQALVAGEVEWGFASLPSAVGQIRGGLLRALAISNPNPAMPEVQTLAAQGFSGFEETDVWFGSMVPRATPTAVVARLHQAMRAVLDAPGFDARLAQAGYAPAPSKTPEEFAVFTERQIAFWGRLVQASGASID